MATFLCTHSPRLLPTCHLTLPAPGYRLSALSPTQAPSLPPAPSSPPHTVPASTYRRDSPPSTLPQPPTSHRSSLPVGKEGEEECPSPCGVNQPPEEMYLWVHARDHRPVVELALTDLVLTQKEVVCTCQTHTSTPCTLAVPRLFPELPSLVVGPTRSEASLPHPATHHHPSHRAHWRYLPASIAPLPTMAGAEATTRDRLPVNARDYPIVHSVPHMPEDPLVPPPPQHLVTP